MSRIKDFISNNGLNQNGELAYNCFNINYTNSTGERVWVAAEYNEIIKSAVSTNDVVRTSSGFSSGITFWFETGLIFKSYEEMMMEIYQFENELRKLLIEKSKDGDRFKRGQLRISIELFNHHYIG